VRRLTKMLPISAEIIEHIAKDDDRLPPRNVTPQLRTTPINPLALSMPALETTSEIEEELS